MYIHLLEVCCAATRLHQDIYRATYEIVYLPTYLPAFLPTDLPVSSLSLSLSRAFGFFSNFKFRGTVGMRFLRAEMAERMAISASLIAPGSAGRARGPPSTKHAERRLKLSVV
jgi:hypothetical protein